MIGTEAAIVPPLAAFLARIELAPTQLLNSLQSGRAGRPRPRLAAQLRSLRGNKLPNPNPSCVLGLGFLFVASVALISIGARYS